MNWTKRKVIDCLTIISNRKRDRYEHKSGDFSLNKLDDNVGKIVLQVNLAIASRLEGKYH